MLIQQLFRFLRVWRFHVSHEVFLWAWSCLPHEDEDVIVHGGFLVGRRYHSDILCRVLHQVADSPPTFRDITVSAGFGYRHWPLFLLRAEGVLTFVLSFGSALKCLAENPSVTWVSLDGVTMWTLLPWSPRSAGQVLKIIAPMMLVRMLIYYNKE